ncbi:MAG: RidA family protein [Alphaproteobacteria bacterium]|nr:RidA family protein [Alphaproteobacteria bacterium]
MARRLISTGGTYEKKFSYSRAVVEGPWVFVAGTTGYDYATMTMPAGVAAQTENTLRSIGKALRDAGSSFDDVVRAIVYVTRADDMMTVVGPLLGKAFAKARPAMTGVVCQLIDPAIKVEIEVTALKRGAGGGRVSPAAKAARRPAAKAARRPAAKAKAKKAVRRK